MTLEEIAALALHIHQGQHDTYGRTMSEHLRRVAHAPSVVGGGYVRQAAAWLHDAIALGGYTREELLAYGVSSDVVALVEILTPEKTFRDHVRMVCAGGTDAVAVDLANIVDLIEHSPEPMAVQAAGMLVRNALLKWVDDNDLCVRCIQSFLDCRCTGVELADFLTSWHGPL
jgi:hypothetical protein